MSRRFACVAVWGGWMAMMFAAIPGVPGVAWAAPTENHVLQAVPCPGTVKLDGDLSDWDRAVAIVLADDTTTPGKLVRVSAMYDAEGLYLAFEFKDPSPMENFIDPAKTPSEGWRGDAVQLRINCGPNGPNAPIISELVHHVDCYWSTKLKQPAAYVVTTNMGQSDATKRVIEQAIGKGVDAAFRMDDDKKGYVQEMRLSWAMLRPSGKAYEPGQSLHMAIEAMWDNGMGDGSDRITDLVNPAQTDRGAIWTKPDTWGTVLFVDKDQIKPSETAAHWDAWVKAYKPAALPTGTGGGQLAADRPCSSNSDAVSRLLNQWYAEGTAAGNKGDYYDNRDRGHSQLPMHLYPQLSKTQYTEEQKKAGLDWALSMGVWPYSTMGNSSTSAPPDRGGSNPRQAMTDVRVMEVQRGQYLHNNLNLYPEHRDYDPGHSGHPGFGDLYPVNAPYWLISQGSSSSDQPFMRAVVHTMAAFTPRVKKALVEHGLLMPTIQRIFRASNKQVVNPGDYFTGKAHPIVFQGDQIDEVKMVTMAHDMTLDTIPPLARLRVLEEQPARPGIDAPKDMPGEALCDQSEVIGRVHRRWARYMTLKLTAENSMDWQGKTLTYRWVLLQGDPRNVTIAPSADGKEAEIRVGWHDRFDTPGAPGGAPGMRTNRVDIGLFVSNGQSWSTPAFVCVFHPDNELRTYDANDRPVDFYSAAVDTTLGYDTHVVIPADGAPAYDIRDWPKLIEQAVIAKEGPASRLFGDPVTGAQRQVIAQAVQEVCDAAAQYQVTVEAAKKEAGTDPQADQKGTKPKETKPVKVDQKRAAEFCKPLLLSQPSLGGMSVKDFIEHAMNRRVNDLMWYPRDRAMLDQPAGPAQQKLEKARQRLIDLGIYRALPGGGWELHSIRAGDGPVTDRLTAYERMEIRRFQLTVLTQVLLPGVVVRDAKMNYVDDRIAHAQPVWDVFTYSTGPDGDERVTVDRHETDKPIPVPVREQP
ncbi:MAG: DOMON domain-containing protein [Phycisphaerales bacterium]